MFEIILIQILLLYLIIKLKRNLKNKYMNKIKQFKHYKINQIFYYKKTFNFRKILKSLKNYINNQRLKLNIINSNKSKSIKVYVINLNITHQIVMIFFQFIIKILKYHKKINRNLKLLIIRILLKYLKIKDFHFNKLIKMSYNKNKKSLWQFQLQNNLNQIQKLMNQKIKIIQILLKIQIYIVLMS